ncbi:MAG: MgtC/SapB family protein [Chloroflexota bacterium]
MEIPPVAYEQLIMLAKLAAAIFLGALLGADREAANKPAGLRTHMMVSGAAVLLVMVGEVTVERHLNGLGDNIIRTDPIRIIEAVIVGISFLGAGTIIHQRREGEVRGLTTAASLLLAAVVGINVALSQWIVAVGATVLVLIILRLLPAFERQLHRRQEE